MKQIMNYRKSVTLTITELIKTFNLKSLHKAKVLILIQTRVSLIPNLMGMASRLHKFSHLTLKLILFNNIYKKKVDEFVNYH